MLYTIDTTLTAAINSLSRSNPWANDIALLVSAIGIPAIVLAVASLWWMGRDRLSARFAALTAGLSFVLALGINQCILLFVQRVRPYDVGVTSLLGSPSADPSFPSDHATGAFAIAIAFLMLKRKSQGILLFACAAVISLSRVFVGTHYVGDILGGMLTAFAAAFVVRLFYQSNSAINQKLVSVL